MFPPFASVLVYLDGSSDPVLSHQGTRLNPHTSCTCTILMYIVPANLKSSSSDLIKVKLLVVSLRTER